jgi:hypothetical protein
MRPIETTTKSTFIKRFIMVYVIPVAYESRIVPPIIKAKPLYNGFSGNAIFIEVLLLKDGFRIKN